MLLFCERVVRLSAIAVVVSFLVDGTSAAAQETKGCCAEERALLSDIDPQVREDAIIAAKQFAASLAGGDNAKYVELFEGAIQVALNAQTQSSARSVDTDPAPVSRGLTPEQVRRRTIESRATEGSIWNDEEYLKNYRKLIEENGVPRIVGGVETELGEFSDCVAVGSPTRWCCTGTLVAPRVVVTAGHCDPQCTSRIFVGLDADQASPDDIIAVQKAVRHPGYARPSADLIENDLTVLILKVPVQGVSPRKIGTDAIINSASWCRAVGFGRIDRLASYGYGIQRKVDVAIASSRCADSAAGSYACNQGLEIVAGGSGKDSCAGDSGGPLYVRNGSKWVLAGATSRATKEWRVTGNPCGEGGIYVRVDKYLDWIRSVCMQNGVDGPEGN